MRNESLRIAGEKVAGERHFEVRNPFSGEVVGTVPRATPAICARSRNDLLILRGSESRTKTTRRPLV